MTLENSQPMNEEENPIVGITFIQNSITADRRYAIIKQFMIKHSKCIVEFNKIDGTLRKMECTLDPDTTINESSTVAADSADYNTMTVWCIDKDAWRTFKTNNVLSISANS